MSVLIQRGGGAGIVDPSMIGGRLSLVTADPAPALNQTGKSTLYYTPDRHNLTSLYTGASWRTMTVNELSLALSGLTSGALYDVFLDYNDGSPQLVLQIWAGTGVVITGATNATPIVITSTAHPFQNGDQVYTDGVRDSTTNVIPFSADGEWIVANRAANTWEQAGSVGTGTYFRAGVASGRLAAALLTRQDGVRVKAADTQQRYLGTIRTTAATTTEDSETKRFVWNAHNQIERHLRKQDMDDHLVQNILASGATGYRLYQEGGVNSSRVEWVQGLKGKPVKLSMRCGVSAAAGAHAPVQVGIDASPREDYSTGSHLFVTNGNGQFQMGTLEFCRALQAGYHYADLMEAEIGNVSTTMLQEITTGVVWG